MNAVGERYRALLELAPVEVAGVDPEARELSPGVHLRTSPPKPLTAAHAAAQPHASTADSSTP